MLTIFHVSDLHFGQPAVPEQIEAIEGLVREKRYDVVAISGDLTQRARAGEFLRARAFIREAQRVSRTIVVPGNHDVPWWRSPLGLGSPGRLTEGYTTYISPELEPSLRVPGAVFVGINTAHGVTSRTLTWNIRDIGIMGDVRRSQIERARALLRDAPPGDCKVIVMHHNPVRGEISQRHGLKHTRRILGAFAEIGVDVILCGHDHQEAVHFVEHTRKGTVISTAGTVSNRSRGGRPSSVNVLTVSPSNIIVTTSIWSREQQTFVEGPVKCFDR